MKIRAGFVSNSSSSSFCLFGIYLTDTDAETMVKYGTKAVKPAPEEGSAEAEDYDEYAYLDDFSAECDKAGLELLTDYENGGAYLGLSYENMKQNETRAHFEGEVQKRIKKVLPKLPKSLKCEFILDTISN
jgi:hypothetical protein